VAISHIQAAKCYETAAAATLLRSDTAKKARKPVPSTMHILHLLLRAEQFKAEVKKSAECTHTYMMEIF